MATRKRKATKKKTTVKKYKSVLKRQGKKQKVIACNLSETEAKKRKKNLEKRGFYSDYVERAGKFCLTKGPKKPKTKRA